MKKTLSILLVLSAAFVFIGCGSDSGSSGLPTPDFVGIKNTAVVADEAAAIILANEAINAKITIDNVISLAFAPLDYIGNATYYTPIDATSGTLVGCGDSGSAAITNLVEYAGGGGSATITYTNFVAYDPADELGNGDCLIDETIESGSLDLTMSENWNWVDDCVGYVSGTTSCDIGSASGKITMRDLVVLNMDAGDYGPASILTFDGAATFYKSSSRSSMSETTNVAVKFTTDAGKVTVVDNLKDSSSRDRLTDIPTGNATGNIYIADYGKLAVSTPDKIINDVGDLVLKGDIDIIVDMATWGWEADIDGSGTIGAGESGTVAIHNDY